MKKRLKEGLVLNVRNKEEYVLAFEWFFAVHYDSRSERRIVCDFLKGWPDAVVSSVAESFEFFGVNERKA